MIKGIKLYCRRVQVQPGMAAALEEHLRLRPARYPIRRTQTKSYFIEPGRTDLPNAPILQGQIPRRMTVCFCENAAFSGAYNKNPFNFKPFDLNELYVMVDAKKVPHEGLTMDWDRNHFAVAYLHTLENLGVLGDDRSIGLTFSHFKEGSTIYVFNLSPTDDSGAWELAREGKAT